MYGKQGAFLKGDWGYIGEGEGIADWTAVAVST